MTAEFAGDLKAEIGHVLFIDIVGYSKLLINEQGELLEHLKEMMRASEQVRAAEADGKLIRLATGDGMALVFRNSPEAPAQCALELARADKAHPELQLRMGIHSGPINPVSDVNERVNVTGAGINMAQRVMDCGDAGHILLSKRAADDLAQYRHWQPFLHDIGECEVKHGVRLGLVNLYRDDLGNPALPEKLRNAPATKRQIPWPALFILLVSLGATIFGIVLFYQNSPPPRPLPAASPAAFSPTPAEPGIPAKSIAVLPFENLSDDRQNAYFADGVQDEVLSHLARIADLKVISRTSVMQYKAGAQRNLREIGQQLGVAHVLEGSVQRAGAKVRVIAQLIDARTDAHLWGQTYDRDLADVFAIQSDIAKTIADQLQAKLSPRERAAIEQRPTANLAAFDLYTRAKTLLLTANFSALKKDSLLQAIELLNQAVTHDPSFLLAYCQLTGAHDYLYFFGLDRTPARLALADAAVETALRLRPDSGEAHLALAQHVYHGYLDYDRARAEIAIAQRTLPNNPLPLQLLGYIDRRQARWNEAVRNLEHASELDPRIFFVLEQISFTYQCLRRYAEMASILDRVLTIVPKDVDMKVMRGSVDLDWRADTRPMHTAIDGILADDPSAAAAWLLTG